MKKELFIQKASTQSGLITHLPSHYNDDLYNWSLFIAIKPTAENLSKALYVLAEILCEKNFTFTCLVLNDPTQAKDISGIHWDGAAASFEHPDKYAYDYRGQEVEIIIQYNREQARYEQTPEALKQLCLSCWQQLQKNQVQLAYIAPALSANTMSTEPGIITPFSYSLTKLKNSQAAENRHQILNSDQFFTDNTPNPFAEITITEQDLRRYRIDAQQSQKFLEQRIIYQDAHAHQLLKETDELLQTISQQRSDTPAADIIFKQLEILFQNEADIKSQLLEANNSLINSLSFLYPRLANDELSEHPLLVRFKKCWQQCMMGKSDHQALKTSFYELLNHARTKFKQEITAIIADYNSNPELLKILQQNSIEPSHLPFLVNAQPAQMQLLYCRLVHIQHELTRLEYDRQFLNRTAILKKLESINQRSHYNFFLASVDCKNQAISRLYKQVLQAPRNSNFDMLFKQWKEEKIWRDQKTKELADNMTVIKTPRNVLRPKEGDGRPTDTEKDLQTLEQQFKGCTI